MMSRLPQLSFCGEVLKHMKSRYECCFLLNTMVSFVYDEELILALRYKFTHGLLQEGFAVDTYYPNSRMTKFSYHLRLAIVDLLIAFWLMAAASGCHKTVFSFRPTVAELKSFIIFGGAIVIIDFSLLILRELFDQWQWFC